MIEAVTLHLKIPPFLFRYGAFLVVYILTSYTYSVLVSLDLVGTYLSSVYLCIYHKKYKLKFFSANKFPLPEVKRSTSYKI